eukprot:COSAG03_NODE_4130_length_1673_cov_1.818933_2_plen_82_part_00
MDFPAVVKGVGYSLAYASERLRDSKEVVLAAVKNYGYSLSLQYASERLRDSEEVVLAGMENSWDPSECLQFASKRLQDKQQ